MSENCRPIYDVSTVSKRLKKVVHRYLLTEICALIHIYSERLYARRSIESHLASFLRDTSTCVLSHHQIDVFYFDCSKSFDHVNYHLVLRNCSAYGLSPAFCDCFATYLEHRENFDQYAGAKSRSLAVTSGALQGSILGRLIFNFFGDDVQLFIKHTSLWQFADDMKVYRALASHADYA